MAVVPGGDHDRIDIVSGEHLLWIRGRAARSEALGGGPARYARRRGDDHDLGSAREVREEDVAGECASPNDTHTRAIPSGRQPQTRPSIRDRNGTRAGVRGGRIREKDPQ